MQLKEMLHSAAPVLEALHDGVVAVDERGAVLYVNEANARITGLKSAQILGRSAAEVAPESHLLQVLHTGQPLVGVRSRVAGHEVVSTIVPVTDGGVVIGAISIFRDLTEVRALTAQLQEAQNTIALLRDYLGAPGQTEGVIVGRSPAAHRAFTLALRAASVGSPVLIEGESGTGKEVLARLIHARSERAKRPFIAFNCAAVPGTLIESELFGYEEGAFTGARKGGRAGLLEVADGGTLFLDEVGDMEPGVQAKLLRALQNGEFRRLGGTALRTSDVRIISATNRPLAGLIEARQFREDLYYRLRVIRIILPPLRERREDLPDFVGHALRRACERLKRPLPEISPGAMRLLLTYAYPGNVRELENLVEQAVVFDDDQVIGDGDLPPELSAPGPDTAPRPPTQPALDPAHRPPTNPVPRPGRPGLARHAGSDQGPDTPAASRLPSREQAERDLLAEGLRRCASRTELARQLGIGRATLYRKLARYGLL